MRQINHFLWFQKIWEEAPRAKAAGGAALLLLIQQEKPGLEVLGGEQTELGAQRSGEIPAFPHCFSSSLWKWWLQAPMRVFGASLPCAELCVQHFPSSSRVSIALMFRLTPVCVFFPPKDGELLSAVPWSVLIGVVCCDQGTFLFFVLFLRCAFFPSYPELVESLCVNKRFVGPDRFWMQTKPPNHLNSAVSAVFCVPWMVFYHSGSCSCKTEFLCVPTCPGEIPPAQTQAQSCDQLWVQPLGRRNKWLFGPDLLVFLLCKSLPSDSVRGWGRAGHH